MGPGICFCSFNVQVRVTETALNPEGKPPSLDLNFVTGIVVANDSVSVLQHLALQLEREGAYGATRQRHQRVGDRYTSREGALPAAAAGVFFMPPTARWGSRSYPDYRPAADRCVASAVMMPPQIGPAARMKRYSRPPKRLPSQIAVRRVFMASPA